MHFLITSTQNPKIKSLLLLEKPRERRKQQLFIIEGAKEVRMALEAGYKIGNIFFCDEIIDKNESADLLTQDKLLVPMISKRSLNKIAIREARVLVLAVARQKTHRLEDVHAARIRSFCF